MLKRVFLALLLSLLLGACAPAAPTPTPTPTVSPMTVPTVAPTVAPSPTPAPTVDPVTLKVLFIGNSLTYYQDLPKMFAKLAKAGGHEADVDMSTKPGVWLQDHVTDPDTLKKLAAAEWDIVILQEAGYIPRDEARFGDDMYPAARALDQKIKDRGARTIFYMTWADPLHVFTDKLDDFAAEQVRVSAVHRTIAQELGADVAPVGDAFARSLQRRPDLLLWWEADEELLWWGGGPPQLRGNLPGCLCFLCPDLPAEPGGSDLRTVEAGFSARAVGGYGSVSAIHCRRNGSGRLDRTNGS